MPYFKDLYKLKLMVTFESQPRPKWSPIKVKQLLIPP